jgi:methylenetetrahydrofolate dehydrogenase (NADP+)/methenyltetrahydrofolate cyclohydrolase
VTACGVPELVDGEMLSDGVVVVDVSANRAPDGGVVGDVAFDAARTRASAITPVPGGVGPVTVAKLLENVVIAAAQHADASGGSHDGAPGL